CPPPHPVSPAPAVSPIPRCPPSLTRVPPLPSVPRSLTQCPPLPHPPVLPLEGEE
ncbi:hypothetical protein KUCAC02_020663, partial [Chaenocephalus aceratus]